MNQVEKEQLVLLFKTHLDEITGLQYYSYQAAETLYQRTKMFAERYFPTRGYGIELIGIKFKFTSTFFENAVTVWETGITKLVSIAQAMLDDAILTPVTPPTPSQSPVVKVVEDTKKVEALQNEMARLQHELQSSQTDLISARAELAILKTTRTRAKKFVIYALAFLLCSAVLWTFNGWVKWSWLTLHPKKIGLYLSAQALLSLGLVLPIFKGDRTLKISVFSAMFIAVIVGLFQLI